MLNARAAHTATLLEDGRVLIAGGFDAADAPLNSSELYCPDNAQAPPDFVGVLRPRDTLWISPRCPRGYQTLKVFEARPPGQEAARLSSRLFEALPHELLVEPRRGPIRFQTRGGYQAEVSAYAGRVPNRPGRLRVVDGAIADARYIYPIRMECDEDLYDETMALFEPVLESIRPFPERGPGLAPDLGVMTNWSD